MTTFVLDSGALIALERRNKHMLALVDELYRDHRVAYVPAGVVAQVWRGSARQHDTARLVRNKAVKIDPLTDEVAFALGTLLGRTGTSDVVDAHVVHLARRMRAVVITSDPGDIAKLDPDLTVLAV